MGKKKISRAVWILSIVSLLTDVASEMLYPVMPVYLKSIGFSAILIGILEGFAEATAGFSKGYFGNLSDRLNKRVVFVRWGYFLSAVSKPMLALFTFPFWVFLSRGFDRFGKGIRTSARDSILSAEATPETKARVFGLHRAMDTAGAMAGPVAALVFLYYYPEGYATLFLIAFIPGISGVMLTYLIKEKTIEGPVSVSKKGFFSFLLYWKTSSKEYRKLVAGLLFFTLINSSDVFLLLLIKHIGYSNNEVILVYIYYNFVYAISSYPAGAMADKIGLKNVFTLGLIMFAIVYGGMSMMPSLPVIFILFSVYGVYAASTESISKAWITNITQKQDAATAIGFYTSFGSLFTMLASVMAGFLWSTFNPSVTFAVSAAGAIAGVLYFRIVRFNKT